MPDRRRVRPVDREPRKTAANGAALKHGDKKYLDGGGTLAVPHDGERIAVRGTACLAGGYFRLDPAHLHLDEMVLPDLPVTPFGRNIVGCAQGALELVACNAAAGMAACRIGNRHGGD